MTLFYNFLIGLIIGAIMQYIINRKYYQEVCIMIDKVTRKRMEDLIYNFFDLFDPTGRNTEWYKNKFKD